MKNGISAAGSTVGCIEGCGHTAFLGYSPELKGLGMDIRTFSLLSRSARGRRGLTRNIEYTPATHIPSLPTHAECAVGEDEVFGRRT